MYKIGIITASDKGYHGERDDISGKLIMTIMEEYGYEVVSYKVLPDEKDLLMQEMIELSDCLGVHLILTTGGTGFSQRDITPEATLEVIERNAPGIVEAIRQNSMLITRRAMLSRAVSGIRGNTLIVNMPGSPKAVKESLLYIIDELAHGLEILNGDASECARPMKA